MTALAAPTANHHMLGNVLINVEGKEAFVAVYSHAHHKLKAEPGVAGDPSSTTS